MIRVGVPYSGCPYESEVPCTSEAEALAFAAGVIIGGGEAMAFMQNDGFLSCLNVVATFLKPYDIKVPIELKVRHDGVHKFSGDMMPAIMKAMGYAEGNS